MKIYIRTYESEGELATITEKEVSSLNEAQLIKKTNEKIHICYHDEKSPKPCRLI